VGVGYVLTAAILFSVNGSVSKAVLSGTVSSLHLVEVRCLVASVIFALIAAVRDPASLRIGRRELGFVVVYAIVGVAMVQWLYFVSIARMPVSITLLIEFTAPVLIALWVRFVRKEPVRGRIWIALTLTLIGLALVARVWAGLTLDAIGLIAAVAAALSLATYYLLGEHGMGRRDPWSLAAWSFGIAGLFWAVVAPPWTFPFGRLTTSVDLGVTGLSAQAWAYVTFVIVLGTVAPFGLTMLGLRAIGATRVGLIATAEPPLAGLVAWPVLNETLTTVQIAGALVVLAGIVLAETARSTLPESAPAPAPGT
jgi:drug/metabolite transporter (DMT)-like permease